MRGKSWPVYYRDDLEVGNPSACTAVCTLWTPRTLVANGLERESFAVLGNLYSRDGINYIIRNTLANPAIRYLIVCGRSLNDSADALLAFFKNGVDVERRIIGNGGLIDRDIPVAAIERVRHNVGIVDLRGVVAAEQIWHDIRALKPLPPFGKPQLFPTSELKLETYPSERAGIIVRGVSVPDTWVRLVYHVMTFGRVSPTDYGTSQRELLDVMADISFEPPAERTLPNWMPISAEQIGHYVSSLLSADKRADISYTYGNRLLEHFGISQVDSIVSDLLRFRSSRRAVACLWDPRSDSKSTDPPCIVLLQVQIRDNYLHLTIYVRSHDVFRAWHYNAFALRELQGMIARRIEGAILGNLTIISNSAHIYEDCWDVAMGLIRKAGDSAVWGKRFRPDPRGNFVIRLENHSIAVYHYTPDGDKIRRLEGKTAKDLARQLEPYMSLISHAIYMGRELQRAEDALNIGGPYVQDAITEGVR